MENFWIVFGETSHLIFVLQVHDNQDRDSELKVLVHQSHAGAVIGRGGSRIKELREENGVDLKVISGNTYTINNYTISYISL